MNGKIVREGVKHVAKVLVSIVDVGHENRLMALGSPGEHRGNKRDAEARTLIAKEIREAGRFVVFVFRQERIGHLAHRHEEKRQTDSLEHTRPRFVRIVGIEVQARVAPHHQSQNHRRESDQPG